jgi:hypothetical protein
MEMNVPSIFILWQLSLTEGTELLRFNMMGISNNVTMDFDLSTLVPVCPSDELQSLVGPFLVTEIDSIIKMMPIDKAPGPDGFNGVF